MLAKVPNLNKIDRSVTTGDEEKETMRSNLYGYTGKRLGLEIYDTVAVLDRREADEHRVVFLETLSRETITSITDYNSTIAPPSVIVKTTTVDIINSNITLNKKDRE